MKSKTDNKPAQSSQPSVSKNGQASNGPAPAAGKKSFTPVAPQRKNPHGIPDYRLEVPNYHTIEEWTDGKLHYTVKGDFTAPAPSLCESKYLTKETSIKLYRFMLLNRKMEQALENLFKQQKVIGGVYLGLGQEGCSVASAYALKKEDWCAPMIRNQGSMLVRGFSPADTMMQYMAKADSPTKGRDS